MGTYVRLMDRRFTPRRTRHCDGAAYVYLLGVYLGDGCISETARCFQLRVTLDASYPGIVDEVATAIARVHPGVNVRRRSRPGFHVVIVDAASVSWPLLFPQHGPGRKHARRIVLTDWQWTLVEQHPRAFLRGLIHSDGCRTVNRFETRLPSGRIARYAYPRYFFTNESEDIHELFQQVGALVGVRTTRSSRKNLSIADRASVALLDEFIGPKT
jgi:hypothetical protein